VQVRKNKTVETNARDGKGHKRPNFSKKRVQETSLKGKKLHKKEREQAGIERKGVGYCWGGGVGGRGRVKGKEGGGRGGGLSRVKNKTRRNGIRQEK